MRDPNRLRAPRGKSGAFREGWQSCQLGRNLGANPFVAGDAEWKDWIAGFEARGDRGFRVDHLPRTASGAFA